MDDTATPFGGTEWTVTALGGERVAVDPAPTLVFDVEESRVSGFAGVNRLTGTFTLDEDSLRFGPIATTRMAGSEAAMRLEAVFIETLGEVASYALDGRTLTLLAGLDAVVVLAC